VKGKSTALFFQELFMLNGSLLLNEGPVPSARLRHDIAVELQQRIRQLQHDFYNSHDNRVDYQALSRSADFVAYCECSRLLQEYDLHQLKSPAEKTAFWINLYNSMIIHGVIALGVRKTVKEVRNFFGRVQYRIGIADYSADDIEHGILRGNRRPPYGLFPPFDDDDLRLKYALDVLDPRIHFALVCGSTSCPPIGYYVAEVLEQQLETATANFVNGTEVEVVAAQNLLRLSPIFKWYSGDFKDHGGVPEFLARYRRDPNDVDFLRNCTHGVRLEWKNYNWALNA
jgi:hypothetical protein